MSMDLLNELDGFSGMRRGLANVARDQDRYAGIPMPLEGHRLIVEPTYPGAEVLSSMNIGEVATSGETIKVRSKFWSTRYKCWIATYDQRNSRGEWKVYYGVIESLGFFPTMMFTLGACDAWGLEQEQAALKLLGSFVRHHIFKQYLLTGMFLETSKRSGLTYLFRKLRPTVVIDARNKSPGVNSRILCTLCMHPIAYYEGSWAGAMCPTDDVIAHLMMMRGDEHMLWRRCNQHPPHMPQSAL